MITPDPKLRTQVSHQHGSISLAPLEPMKDLRQRLIDDGDIARPTTSSHPDSMAQNMRGAIPILKNKEYQIPTNGIEGNG